MYTYPLTPEQRYFYDYQNTAPDSTMYNHFPMLVKLNDWVDAERLADSIMKTLHAHPAFLSVIEEHGGTPYQRYVPDLITSIPVEHITESEVMALKDELIQPFYWGEALCRFRLFQTERAKYLFFDDHHIICDGTGKAIFLRDIQRAYDGQDIAPDSWFEYLLEREAEKSSPHYIESRKWYEGNYGGQDFCGYPAADFTQWGGGINEQGLLLQHSGITLEGLESLRQLHVNSTEFFIAISLLATSEYNHDQNVIHTWTYRGRYRKAHNNIAGLMIQDLPVKLEHDVFASVRRQLKECLVHKDYPYTSLDEHFLEDDKLCLLHNGRLYSDGPRIDISDGLVEMHNKFAGSQNILDIEIIETDDGIDLLFDYAARRYKPESIERYSELFIRLLHDTLRSVNANA